MPDTSKTSANGIKMVLTGDSGTGKSSLLLSYTEQRFLPPEEAIATVGVDFRLLKREYKGNQYKIYIWDTAGQERFRTLTSSFYRGAAVVFVVFDVSNRESFLHLDSWIDEAKRFTAPDHSVHVCIVSNKMDVDPSEIQVSQEEALQYAKDHGAEYRQVSARTMSGVQAMFDEYSELVATAPRPLPELHTIEINSQSSSGSYFGLSSCTC